ncbi:NAD(P)-binding protein [Decorospora gaudefroyi]|uniref:NAD(P)-binding protein n=1 Tax=Decorospora gaudefroyi TaxID=184978 RepID=A0A6A5K8N0_9PLEO|nr:NAD(P)-binding protein [Decorospora gaudefroyi]
MSGSILTTGASGYLGGSLLARLHDTSLPSHKTLYALVRSKAQAEAVKSYGAEPLFIDFEDEQSVARSIVERQITIIFFLVDAMKPNMQIPMIKALAEVKKQTGLDVHFLHTSGAKIFSEHAGLPTDHALSDDEPGLYRMQKDAESPHAFLKQATNTNNTIIETAENLGVRSYIFIPCIVYGEGQGFGNKISIQTTAVIKAAKGVGRMYDINPEGATWPVCHIHDNTQLYMSLLLSILNGKNPGHGKNGYYLASSGSIAWYDLYSAVAKALTQRGVLDSAEVQKADNAALEKMAEALGCPKQMVAVQLGGKCTLQPRRGLELGWKPQYASEHIIEKADAEVELILRHLKN